MLGIDWGEKRIGLAFADSIGVALPVDPAVSTSKRKRFMQIENLIKERSINELVVGYPLNMNGSVGLNIIINSISEDKINSFFENPKILKTKF